MIDTIKTKLIHWLGGYTEAECREKCIDAYKVGADNISYSMKVFADRLYVLPADEWCKEMYERIKQGYQ